MKAVTTKNDNFLVTQLPTMTSLEMVDYINADRKSKAEAEGLTFPCKKYTRLQHKHFMVKVPKVLGETSAKFLAYDIFTAGNGAQSTRKTYRFPKREACLMAMRHGIHPLDRLKYRYYFFCKAIWAKMHAYFSFIHDLLFRIYKRTRFKLIQNITFSLACKVFELGNFCFEMRYLFFLRLNYLTETETVRLKIK